MALAALGALLAACASEAVAPPPATDYRPAPRSTLVSAREFGFVVARRQEPAQLTTVLALQQGGASPQPVAQLVQVRQGEQWYVAIRRLPPSGSADREIAILEQLYVLVLRQEPLARYCLGSDLEPCEAVRDDLSQAQVLQRLAEARDRAAVRSPNALRWQVVELSAAPTGSYDVHVVGVRVTSRQLPLEGVFIYFNQAPHSLCSARTRADGVAVCRLQDQHGDEHEHDHAMRVVATYPGDVQQDGVLLPTTQVLPASAMPPLSSVRPGKP